MLGVTADSDAIEKIDEWTKMFMFQNWVADANQQAEFAREVVLGLAQFWNPEAVANIRENATYAMEEDEFDKFSSELLEKFKQEDGARKRRKRRKGTN